MLDHTELVRRLDEDGMALPNGRSLVGADAAWRDFLARLKDGNWTTTWPDEQGRSPSTVMDFADYAFAKGFVEVAPTVIIQLYPSWGTDAIWFDFNAREMRSQQDVDALSAFIRMVGRTTGAPVELSYEGRDEDVFAAYDPHTDEFRWTD
jgi:hypothetical protein